MFNNEKKYTLKEFKDLFDKAQLLTIQQLEKDMKEAAEKNGRDSDGFSAAIFTMQNMLVAATLKKNLFQEND